MSVLRRDYPKATPILWGSFDGLELAVELGEKPDEFQKRYQIQFEIDYRLRVRYYIWEGKRPHFRIDPDVPSLTVAGQGNPVDKPSADSPERSNKSLDLFVNVMQAQASGKEPLKLIGREQELNETFHYSDGSTGRGITVPLPDNFDMDGKIDIYTTADDAVSLHLVGSLARPEDGEAARRTTDRLRATVFPRRYSLSLDDRGLIRIHLGEVPYWRTDSFAEWKGQPGRVLRRDLGLVQPPPLEDRDPFCGKH
jgi:hypothetical protein